MIDISFVLNREPVTLQVDPGETLLEMLRDRLDLTGTKRGCEVGECGACTVLIDGVPSPSCLTMAAQIDGHAVTTIEGIGNSFSLSKLQEAFIEAGAVQCGFCTPGMILTAHALLEKNPHPTREEIKRGLSGNFCRCGAYGQILDAVEAVSKIESQES